MRALPLAVILLAASLGAPAAAAYPDPDKVPRYQDSACFEEHDKRFTHDYLGIVPDDLAFELEGAACEIYATTSAHFVFVTVADTEGESLENYAFHLFEEWGIGDAERLDGVMLLYVRSYLGEGAAIRIEVGYGLEGVLSSFVTEAAWNEMIAARDRALDAGQDAEAARIFAALTGSAYLLGALRDGYTEAGFPAPTPRSESPPLLFWIVVIVVILIIIVLLAQSSRGRRGWAYTPTSGAWSGRSNRVWVPSTYQGGGGSFGGGGGFGGGRSGGGGRGGRF